MTAKIPALGWGSLSNVGGGLDMHVGKVFERLENQDGVDVEFVLPAGYAPDREGIVGVPTGERDIIARVGRLGPMFVERAAEVDIVHVHDWFGYGLGSRAKSNSGDVEWMTTFHSFSPDRNIDPSQREVETERRAAERCDRLLAVNELLADRIKRGYGGDCHVIYNGFPECGTTGHNPKEKLSIDGKVPFFVGRYTGQKGISHLVYTMEKLARDDVTLVMDGLGHLVVQLRRFIELLGVKDCIEWTGYVPKKALDDYYASMDLFASPSLSEPFGITIVETFSTGIRVVATEGGTAEVLPEDCVIKVGPDSRFIAGDIECDLSLEGEPEYEPYTWDRVADETMEYYHSILDEDTDVSTGTENEVEASDAGAAKSNVN